MTRRPVPNIGRAMALVLVVSAVCYGAACWFGKVIWGAR